MTPAEEAAKIAGKYVAVRPVRCPVCKASKVDPHSIRVAVELRNKWNKSFPLIARYLADKKIIVTKGALNAHFYAEHMGHKDMYESRPGRSRA